MSIHSTSRSSETPSTRDKTDNDLIKQLLALQAGQHIELDFGGSMYGKEAPDFHDDDNRYEIQSTTVSTTSDGEESFFNLILGSHDAASKSDPVLKITVSRNVSQKIGVVREDAQWTSYWVCPRSGRSYGNPDWGTQFKLDSVTVIGDIDRCPECGQPR